MTATTRATVVDSAPRVRRFGPHRTASYPRTGIRTRRPHHAGPTATDAATTHPASVPPRAPTSAASRPDSAQGAPLRAPERHRDAAASAQRGGRAAPPSRHPHALLVAAFDVEP
jgi:hypothetical protein